MSVVTTTIPPVVYVYKEGSNECSKNKTKLTANRSEQKTLGYLIEVQEAFFFHVFMSVENDICVVHAMRGEYVFFS